jgi:phytoene dehydrogenase-like protein
VADGIESGSVFVSFSHRDDKARLKNENHRVLNVSTHALPDWWFSRNGNYDEVKKNAETFILNTLREKLPGFSEAGIHHVFTATPVTWDNWVYRKKGRVGGIPQSMERSLLDWTPNQTPFSGLYLCGDTVYPGQGIPGVTLSGINVYRRITKNSKNS